MNDIYFFTSVLAHMDFYTSGSSAICLLVVMSFFVFGPLLFRKVIRIPKGLFISSFISYVIILVIILCFALRLWTPYLLLYLCVTIIRPNFYIVGYIEELTEQLFGPVWWIITNQNIIIYLVTFIMNTLYIFAIIRLVLFIKYKISGEKSQTKQAV